MKSKPNAYTAIHRQYRARYELSSGRTQIRCRPTNILRFAKAVHRCAAKNLCLSFRVAVKRLSHQIRFNPTGRDGVDAHAML